MVESNYIDRKIRKFDVKMGEIVKENSGYGRLHFTGHNTIHTLTEEVYLALLHKIEECELSRCGFKLLWKPKTRLGSMYW